MEKTAERREQKEETAMGAAPRIRGVAYTVVLEMYMYAPAYCINL